MFFSSKWAHPLPAERYLPGSKLTPWRPSTPASLLPSLPSMLGLYAYLPGYLPYPSFRHLSSGSFQVDAHGARCLHKRNQSN